MSTSFKQSSTNRFSKARFLYPHEVEAENKKLDALVKIFKFPISFPEAEATRVKKSRKPADTARQNRFLENQT
jgi:hypothetical protein